MERSDLVLLVYVAEQLELGRLPMSTSSTGLIFVT